MNLLLLNWLDRENPRSGGAEHHLHQTFGRLVRLGWRVTAVTSGWRGAVARTELDGIEIHRVGNRSTFALAGPCHARRLVASQPTDLLVEDLNKVPLFAPAWSSVPTLLLVHHLFGGTAFRSAGPPVALFTWLLERPIPRGYRDTPIVAVSQSTRRDLVDRGMDPGRIEVVENGVDLDYFRPGPESDRFPEPTLLYVGRLKRYKRVDLLLEALVRLRREGVPARLLIAGEGDDRRRLEGEARRLGLGEGIAHFMGFVPEGEKLRLFQRSWVHLLTSEKEGWGISVLEAAACGTPTVASDSPGLRDSVLDGRTGILTPHGDPGALVDALRPLLGDAARRGRMGEAGRAFAEAHGWDRSAQRMAEVLRRALAARSTPR